MKGAESRPEPDATKVIANAPLRLAPPSMTDAARGITPQEQQGSSSPIPAPINACLTIVAIVAGSELALAPRSAPMVDEEGINPRRIPAARSPASSHPELLRIRSRISYFHRHQPRIEVTSTSAGNHGPSSSSSQSEGRRAYGSGTRKPSAFVIQHDAPPSATRKVQTNAPNKMEVPTERFIGTYYCWTLLHLPGKLDPVWW